MTQAELYKYLQPIVSGLGGFIKSKGHMVVEHNVLLLMSHDRSFLSVIPIKPLNFIYTAEIKEFNKCNKSPDTFIEQTTFFGSIQIHDEIVSKYHQLYHANNGKLIYEEDLTKYQVYEEDNMFNLQDFEERVKSTNLSWILFNDGNRPYKICISKIIFPLNKGDHSSISIYDAYGDNTRLFRYRIHKNKLKMYADIYTRQFILEDTV